MIRVLTILIPTLLTCLLCVPALSQDKAPAAAEAPAKADAPAKAEAAGKADEAPAKTEAAEKAEAPAKAKAAAAVEVLVEAREMAAVAVAVDANVVAQEVFIVNGQAIQGDNETIAKARANQVNKFLKGHVAFISNVTQFSKEQTEAIAKFDRAWIEEEMKKSSKPAKNAKNAGAGFLGGFVGGGRAVPLNMDVEGDQDPILKLLKATITKEIDAILSDEQKLLVANEKKAKDDFMAEALAEFSVAMLERHMYLKPEQVEQLKPALTGKINKQVGWTVYLSNRQYIPTIPQKAISAVLSDSQLKLVRDLNQNDFIGQQFNLMQMMGIPVEGEEDIQALGGAVFVEGEPE